MSSQEEHPQQQADRRRPFSVNDLNRRTREVKIYNTTTITTTTHSHDASRVSNNVYTNESSTDNTCNYAETQTSTFVNGQPVYASSSDTKNVQRPSENLRSKSAFSTNSDHYQYNSLPITISTNSSIHAVPCAKDPRKIQFIYGKNNQDYQSVQPVVVECADACDTTPVNPNNQHFSRTYYTTADCGDNSYPAFPNVKTSFSTEISDALFNQARCNCHCSCSCSRPNNTVVNTGTKRYVLKNQKSEDSYENYNARTEKPEFNRKNMRVKDVEVECEIEEDPAIFEGSEGYVKNLIGKIQQQYKNPETVHIKITRRQKPQNIDAQGNLVRTPNESYGQIVRKEYYTIRTTNRPKKTSSMSSFVDTANIPYIDGSDDDKSARNSRIDMDRNIYIPNYTIEKHVIYNDKDEDKKRKGKEISIRDLVSSLGGRVKKENLDLNRSESMSPTRVTKKEKVSKKPEIRSKSIDLSEEELSVNGGGFKGFFNCGRGGGRVKSPEPKKEKEPKEIKIKIPKESKIKVPSVDISTKLPNVDVDVNSPKVDIPDLDLHVEAPEIDVNSAEYKNGLKGFFKGLGGKIKAPEVSHEVNVEVPDLSTNKKIDLEIQAPEVDLNNLAAEIEANLPKVDVEVKAPKKPKVREPKVKHDFEIKAPKINMPDFTMPKFKVSKDAQDIELAVDVPEVKQPDIDLNVQAPELEIDINSPEYKSGVKGFFKGLGGKLKLPEAEIKVPEVNVAVPDVDVSLPKVDVDVEVPDVDVNIKGPKVKKPKGPKFDFNMPHVDLPDFHMPKFKGPKVDKPDLDIDLKGPEMKVDVQAPVVDIDLKSPTIEAPELEIDINSPEYRSGVKGFFKGLGGKIKAPEVYLPDVNLSGPEINAEVKSPKVKVPKVPKVPKGKLPKVDLPDVDFNSPNIEVPELEIDINSPEYKSGVKGFFKGLGGKVKIPEGEIKVPEVNVAVPDVDISLPKVDVDVEVPDVDVNIKSPKVKKPKGPKFDFNMPHVDLPDFNMPKFKGPKVDKPEVDIKGLDLEVDAQLPSVDIELPSVDVKAPEIDFDINSPEYQSGLKGMFKGLGGKVKLPEAEIKVPEVSVAIPKTDVDVEVPDIDVNIKGPKVKKPKGSFNFNMPHVDLPDFNMPKFKGPKIDKPEVDIKGLDLEVDAQLPTVDIELPSVDVKTPEIDFDVNSPEYQSGLKGMFKGLGGKVKLPESEIKVPEVNVAVPDVDVSLPKVDLHFNANLPIVDVDVPHADINLPSADLEIDLNSSEYHDGLKGMFKGLGGKIDTPKVELPDIKYEIPSPEVNLPEVNVKSPKIKAPKADTPSCLKCPKLRKPKIKGPAIDFDAELPEAELKSPTLEVPNVDFELNNPDVYVDLPDIQSPELKGGFKGFFKGLGGKIITPEVNVPDVSVKSPELNLPNIELDLPKVPSVYVELKSPTIEMPDLEIDINSPEYKSGVKGFFKGLGGKVKLPEAEIKVPEVNVAVPDVDVSLPKVDVDVEVPDVDVNIKSPKVKKPKGSFNFNMPHVDLPDFHMPKFKGPKIDKPEVDIKGLDLEVDAQLPTVDIELPSVDVKAPEIDFDINSPEYQSGLKGMFKGLGGKVKLPEAEVKVPEVNVAVPDVDVSLPKVDVDVEVPDVDVNIKGAKVKKPKGSFNFNMPKVDLPDFNMPKFKGPKVDKPDIDIKGLDLEVDAHLPTLDIQSPTAHVEVPSLDIDINSPEYKNGLKGFFKGIGGKIKAPEVHLPEVSVRSQHVKLEKPELDVTLPSAEIDIKAPSFDASEIDINSPELKGGIKGFFKGIGGKIKAPEVNLPDFHLNGSDTKNLKIELPSEDLELPEFDINLKEPNVQIIVPPVPETADLDMYDVTIKVSEREIVTKLDEQKTDIYIRGLNLAEHKQFVYGLDLPMTIVNNDWHWSPESVKECVPDRKIFFRQYTDETNSESSNYINSGSFPMGNLSLISNAEVSSHSSRQFSSSSRPVVEYEFRKTRLVKEASDSKPGKAAVKERDQSVPKSKSNTGSFFRRKLSSASSITNLDLKSKFQSKNKTAMISRSESADPSMRAKIDYSIPRKCHIVTRPDFNGLGIHIACDKKTRRFPYIYEIEPNSPGQKSGLRKNDYILEINDEDAVDMEFKELIGRIQEFIKENQLCLTVGNDKAHKKWIKLRSASLNRTKSKV